MVVKKKKITIDGQEIEVPVFDTKITPGKALEVDTLDKLLEEEQIEKELQETIQKIGLVRKRYKNIRKNLDYFYKVGEILQFVDRKGFTKQRGKIWQRMARDLASDLFLFDLKKSPKESRRFPEFMYLIAKFPKEFLRKASWDQWYEITKFKNMFKKEKLLSTILSKCQNGVSGPDLRAEIKSLLSKKIKYEKR